jgi:hypothetical protein
MATRHTDDTDRSTDIDDKLRYKGNAELTDLQKEAVASIDHELRATFSYGNPEYIRVHETDSDTAIEITLAAHNSNVAASDGSIRRAATADLTLSNMIACANGDVNVVLTEE